LALHKAILPANAFLPSFFIRASNLFRAIDLPFLKASPNNSLRKSGMIGGVTKSPSTWYILEEV